MTQLSYAAAGVSIDNGDELVDRIKPAAKRTMIPGVLGSIGGFGALFEISKDYKNPVLVSGTDGVGTKLMLAFQLNRHDTVGQDLVAMSVNDILVQGAKSLFFLDYFGCGKLDVDTAERVVKGIAHGCELAGCALIGGETAEMPGMYPDGEYDLAGFAVGIVDKKKIINGKKIKPGDALIGIKSSGVHSNGYSLVRKLLGEDRKELEKYDVVGPICESSDVFAKDIMLPQTHRGDFLAIRSAGAYGEVMASTYNARPLIKGYLIE